jgi:hypothetical protein
VVRDAAGVRADLAVVGETDFGMRRMRILVVEVQSPSDSGKRRRRHGRQHQNLQKTEAHVNPL